jgi:hypothetical protein
MVCQGTTIQTSSQGISEKIIMNKLELRNLCKKEIDDRIDRMHYLCSDGRSDDATALYLEIQEWVIESENIEVMSLDYITGLFDIQ